MLLLPVWVFLTQPAGALVFMLVLTAALFGCVVLHELGHALAARRFGIGTRDITLYPIGGVARLESVGNKPSEEFWIAVAGPAVNAGLAAAFGLLWLWALWLNPLLAYGTHIGQFLYWMTVLNVSLVVFNMLPAFPMDGGRVLRALLTTPMGRVRATRLATGVAFCLAVGLGIASILWLHNPWLIVVAGFIFFAGQQELEEVEREERARLAAADDADPWIRFGRYGRPVKEEELVYAWEDRPARPARDERDPWRDFAVRPQVTVHVWDEEKKVWVRQ
jgi:Zn-dependent protease